MSFQDFTSLYEGGNRTAQGLRAKKDAIFSYQTPGSCKLPSSCAEVPRGLSKCPRCIESSCGGGACGDATTLPNLMAKAAASSSNSKADANVAGFDLSGFQLISQGAEARVWEGSYLDVPAIIKQRFSKKYRHAILDKKITQSRLKQEVRSILRARKLGVPTPVLYYVEHETNCIYMEKVEGVSLKAALQSKQLDEQGLHTLLREIGRLVALLHDGGLIHGDLTTSNMLIRSSNNQLVMIDFGLSYNNTLAEDKAVDLYVLERAFTSAHSALGNLFDDVLASYRQHSRMWCPTLNKFAEVRMRGRKRTMVG